MKAVQFVLCTTLVVLATGREVDLQVPATGEYEDDNKPIPVVDVSAVIGMDAELPCDISPPDPADSVYLALWYRELAGKPLYSFDIRGRPSETANHWSADPPFGFGRRGTFRVGTKPAALVISNISLLDQGVFRCRVDYRNSPTRNMKINLTIVEEPHAPQILKDDLTDVRGAFAGPFNQGEELRLLCQVHGGRPPPSVYWYIEDEIIDDTFNRIQGRDIVNNRLRYTKLSRDMNEKKISCVAQNNDITPPKTRTVAIKMNLRPERIEIIEKKDYLVAGRPVQLVCEVHGSEPPATVYWYVRDRRVDSSLIKNSKLGSTTTSVFTYTPAENDNGARIICEGTNPNIPGSTIEDLWIISVMYSPRLSLSLGRTLDPQQIKEGNDVYLECEILSNPPVTKLEWYHEETRLVHNSSAGILLSNQSLVIQGIGEQDRGGYTCRGENRQGNSTSNLLNISIKYRPRCRDAREPRIAVDPQQPTIVDCYFDSNPSIKDVIWISSKAGQQQRISSQYYSISHDHTQLALTTERELDYGSLLCYGINEIGRQRDPCVFILEPAGRPYPIESCAMDNKTSILEISCKPGFSGGLPQKFTLQILQSGTKRVLANLTRTDPTFKLADYQTSHPVTIQVYSENKAGSSEPFVVIDRLQMEGVGSPVGDGAGGLDKEYIVVGATVSSCFIIVLIPLVVFVRRRDTGKKLLMVDHCVGDAADRDKKKSGQNSCEENEDGGDGGQFGCPSLRYSQQPESVEKTEHGTLSHLDQQHIKQFTETAPKSEEVVPTTTATKVATKPILKNRGNRNTTAAHNQQQNLLPADQDAITWYSNPLSSSYLTSEPTYPVQDGYSTLQSRRPPVQYSNNYQYYRSPSPSSGVERSPVHRGGTGTLRTGAVGPISRTGTVPRGFTHDTFNPRSIHSYGLEEPREDYQYLMQNGYRSNVPESNI